VESRPPTRPAASDDEPASQPTTSYAWNAEPVQDAVPGLDTDSLPHDARALPELPELEAPDDPVLLLPVPELDELPPLDDATPLPELADEEPEDDTPLPLLMEDELLAPGGYVDLRSLIVEPEPPRGDTRFQLEERSPTGDEDDDFAQLLSQFRRKVAENVSPEDAAAHYDLGLAFKDMGLLDEAINELQVALHAGDMRLKVFEELGLCFLLKQEYSIAEKVLRRALEIRPDDELELLGVYYHLGRTYEGLGKPELARDAYERVLALDINFSDVSDRIARL
jgi:tetratricopeptide (TPR) repeat protein